MLKDRIIQQLSEQLNQLFASQDGEPPGALGELQKSVHSVVQNVFSKLDLVTREEFDAQQKVLAKTRKRVDELEQELEQLSTMK